MSTVYSLEADYYTDPEIYAQERQKIFKKAWWLLGPGNLCQQRGEFLADAVCGWSVFAVRGRDNSLRAFHNLCRHRGAQLLEPGNGRCQAITCPYHAWGYDTAGKLIATPGFERAADFDAAAFGLLPVAVAEWRGMIFVCLDEKPQPFEQWIGSLDGMLADFPDLGELDYHGQFVVDGAANWKTYCDNTVEGYHLHAVHPRLAVAVDAGSVEIKPYDNGNLVAFHVDYGGEGAGLRGNKGLWAYKYPGFQIAVSANAFKIERVEATSINTTRSVNWAWYGNLAADAIEDSFAWSETVVREDLSICESVQRSLEGGFYVNGPLCNSQETNVALFQSLVRQALQAG